MHREMIALKDVMVQVLLFVLAEFQCEDIFLREFLVKKLELSGNRER